MLELVASPRRQGKGAGEHWYADEVIWQLLHPFGWLSFIEEILSVVYFSEGRRKTNNWKCQVIMREMFLKLSRYGYGLLLDIANPSSLLYPSCIIQAAAKLRLERLFRELRWLKWIPFPTLRFWSWNEIRPRAGFIEIWNRWILWAGEENKISFTLCVLFL